MVVKKVVFTIQKVNHEANTWYGAHENTYGRITKESQQLGENLSTLDMSFITTKTSSG
jgi:hypothetical protein